MIYHETGNTLRASALTQQIDTMPGGAAIFAQEISKFGNALFFDLAHAPNFAKQLRQAGIDPDSLEVLPRLSTIGETTQ